MHEATLAAAVVGAAAHLLRAQGQEVLECPRSASVSERGQWSAQQGADVFVSVHLNAGGGRGSECYYYGEEAPNGRALAAAVVREVMAVGGFGAHGQAVRWQWYWKGKLAKLGVLAGGRNWAITGAACLLEVGFIDNEQDAAIMKADGFVARCGRAVAGGILAHLGQDMPDVEPAPEPVDAELETARALLRDRGIVLNDHAAEEPVTWGQAQRVWARLLRAVMPDA
jgi:N-acetylmuramoyl-L-alanine amidase